MPTIGCSAAGGAVSKYYPLSEHLRGLAGQTWHATFADIEQLLGFPLPASARTHPAWWANSTDHMPQKAAWLAAGWRTRDLNLGAGHVLFVRDAGAAPRRTAPARSFGSNDTRPIADGVHDWEIATTIEFRFGITWAAIGRVILDAGGRLTFPAAPAAPAIYRFRIRQGNAERRYIGQTENLARRLGFYRSPGPSQQTNVRLNAEFLRALGAGAEISVAAVMGGAWIDLGAGRAAADLTLLAARCLLENAAILAEGAEGIESLNRGGPASGGAA